MKRSRVLVLTSSFPTKSHPIDGIFVSDLAERLKSKFRITVLAPRVSDSSNGVNKSKNLQVVYFTYFWPRFFQKLCSGGGILTNLKKNPLLFLEIPPLFIVELIEARKIIQKEKINLIHAHWLFPQGFVAACLNYIYKTQFIVTIHGGDVFGFGMNNPVARIIARFILLRSSACTANSLATKKEIEKILPNSGKNNLVPMGVNTKLFNIQRRNSRIKNLIPRLLFVGRLSPEKGVRDLIAAMPMVLRNLPNAKLVIIGDGPEQRGLEREVVSLGIQKSVSFLGSIDHDKLPNYYTNSDIFIGPSLREGLGMTFIEAGLCGCALIGTRVGGILDIIVNNNTGLLVDPKSSDQISKAIIKLWKDSQFRGKVVKNAQDILQKKYDWSIITSKFSYIYSKNAR